VFGVGRIHPAVNVPSFITLTAVNSTADQATVAWSTVRATSVVVKNSSGTTVASGGASGSQAGIVQGYGVTETYTAFATSSSGIVGSASVTLTIPVGPAPVFTATNAGVSALNIPITWTATNTSVVEVYLCNASYVPTSLLYTGAASGSYTYTGGQYATTYYFLLKAKGTNGANDTLARLSSSTAPYVPSDHYYVFTGAPETFVVPPGVTSIQVRSWGSQGGSQVGTYGTYLGAEGGYVSCTVPVTPGETITVKVGGRTGYNNAAPYGGEHGYGGASPLYSTVGPYGHANGPGGVGGGASGIYRGSTPLAISGGGGGAGYEIYVEAGHGSPGVASAAAEGGLGGGGNGVHTYITYNFIETGPGMGYIESTPTSDGGNGGRNLSSEYSQVGGQIGDGLVILHY